MSHPVSPTAHATDGSKATTELSERLGGCACGAIRFRIAGPLMGVGVCHCRDCQKIGGGAPNYVAVAPKTALEVTHGAAKSYTCMGDSGAEVRRFFCSECGTPLWGMPAYIPIVTIKLGALDDNAGLEPSQHIYVASAPAWHLLHEGVPSFPGMPPMEA